MLPDCSCSENRTLHAAKSGGMHVGFGTKTGGQWHSNITQVFFGRLVRGAVALLTRIVSPG